MDDQERIRQLETQVANQQAQIEHLLERLHELEGLLKEAQDRLKKDSHNSSKPPSTDRFARAPKRTHSLRERSGKQPGGQEGHRGHSLQLSDTPDQIVAHPLTRCPCCQQDLSLAEMVGMERRQVWEVPVPGIIITEHQGERKWCSHCQHFQVATFPKEVQAAVQYGPRIQALAVYVHQYQLLPLERTQRLLKDLLGVEVSTGSIVRWVRKAAQTLEPVETRIKAALKAAPVKHKDETGAFALGDNGKQHWFHVTSTPRWTHFFFHRKRGQEAVVAEGIMPGDSNIYVHDGQQTYFLFEQCQHALCGVHLLRELVGVFERTGLPWAQAMIWLLQEGRRLASLAREAGQTQADIEVQRAVRWLYLHLLRAARDVTPVFAAGPKPRRGGPKHSEAWLLLHRLQKYRHEVLLFLADLRVPFDNNLAERDLRMIKLQQKISGTFRSQQGAVDFARLRGYLSTLRKQGLDLFEGIHQTMLGSPLLPTF